MKFDITAYIDRLAVIDSLLKLRDVLVVDVGVQQSFSSVNWRDNWRLSGDGWKIDAKLFADRTEWELYIQDDNLALMFKLKWL
jgi:hypothetical protein